MALRMASHEVDGITVLALDGRIVLGEETVALREKVKSLLAEGKKNIVLDLKNVTMIDSSGLGALVAAHSSAKSSGNPPLVRPLGGELPIEKVGSDSQRSCAIIFWKPSTSRASAQGVHPHQTLDLVQAAGETFGEHVPPDAARAIGASAPHEARVNLCG